MKQLKASLSLPAAEALKSLRALPRQAGSGGTGAALRARGAPLAPEHFQLDSRTSAPVDEPKLAVSVSSGETYKQRLEASEREALRVCMEKCNNNLTKAAEMFGLARTTFRERLLKYGLIENSARSG